MNDKQLLEMAAKAVGLKLKYNWLGGLDARQNWNPLESDADAFRLMVDLNMVVDLNDGAVVACCAVGGALGDVSIELKDNPHAATRRAIVMAAAEIGGVKE